MKEFLKLFFGSFILWGLFYLFINYSGCSSKNDIIQSSKTDTVIRITRTTDTFYRDTGSIKSVPYAVYLPTKIDTPAALTDYYTFKSVKDSFIGENYQVDLSDTLYMNSLFARKARIQTTRRDSIFHTTTTIRKSADGLYLGLQTNLKYVAPSVLYLKGRSAYGAGYGLQQKTINLSYYYKIRK